MIGSDPGEGNAGSNITDDTQIRSGFTIATVGKEQEQKQGTEILHIGSQQTAPSPFHSDYREMTRI